MKKLFKFALFLFLPVFFLLSSRKANAGSYEIEGYNVDISINEDSTFDVKETIQYRFSGEFHRVNRGITLRDFSNEEFCKGSTVNQCGGFEYITINGIYDSKGNKLGEKDVKVWVSNEGGRTELKIEWEFAPKGEFFNNELFSWIIDYKVYGGIGYFPDYDLFYWNVFPDARNVSISNGYMNLIFPSGKDFIIRNEDIKVLHKYYIYEKINFDNRSVSIEASNIPASEPYTVMVKFPKGIVYKPASLELKLSPSEQDIIIDGYKIFKVKNSLGGITPGKHRLRFEASGYYSKDFELEFASGEKKYLDVRLEMSLWQKLIYVGIVFCNILSCFTGIGLTVIIVVNYIRKGKDVDRRRTIVPWFKPPDAISPVIVGSIKDEKVHLVDITSTIINAAVKGFIRIEEVGHRNYKLIKLKDFAVIEKGKSLDSVEIKILNDIFFGKNEVETKNLQYKFYEKIPGINDEVYAKMVELGYFDKRPDKVRGKHTVIGILMIIIGAIMTFALPIIGIFLLGPSIIVSGIVKLIFAKFMPAKTAKGTDIYEKCLGFRMFLKTAERFRMQKLTPEKFEMYLPYAIVFGVEKQWAKNFKDIYTKPPDWYGSKDPWTTFNTIYLVNSLSRMTSATSSALGSSYRNTSSSWSSGGWSGGGWSGGGGFSGGFSGGGGGGGSVGAS